MISALMIFRLPMLLLGVGFFLLCGESLAQIQRFDPRVRRDLEKVYNDWRKAMLTKDEASWKANTALSRRASIRNQMVSQKLPYPGAVFEVPMAPPSLVPLQFTDLRSKGDLAALTYFGKIDFGVGLERVPENLLVLKFIRQEGSWKYDTSRFYNLEGQDEIRRSLKAKNYGFLRRPEFDLPDAAPAVPKPVRKPDHSGEIHLLAIGCTVKIKIDGTPVIAASNGRITQPIMGGLMEGTNTLSAVIDTEGFETAEEQKIGIVVLGHPATKGQRPVELYRFEPEKIPAGSHEARIVADGTRLR